SNVNGYENTIDYKLLNLIIVAIQICYPKIYRMLSRNPGFTTWDKEFAQKAAIQVESDQATGTTGSQWENVLEAACAPDAYLAQHLDDITKLLNMTIDILGKTGEQLGKKMKEIMDKSSVTGINAESNVDDFDKKSLMQKLHKNIIDRIKAKRPDIDRWQLKRNTGNGGVYIWIDDDTCFDVTFTPSTNPDSKKPYSLRLWLDFYVGRPDRLLGKSFDELMQEPEIADNLNRLDDVVAGLLDKNSWFFRSDLYHEDTGIPFKSYIETLRYIHQKEWIDSADITNNPYFWIELAKPSYFENDKIIDTIADLLIANYDFRKAMKNFR
ncbi:MAG: hypothetical protein K2L77_06540, partial [Muribaculaceae bacterium]|nr:hypothetical protein [Muribaculaceae bacterium]